METNNTKLTPFENKWKSLETNETPLTPLKTNENQWTFVNINENRWQLMKNNIQIYENQWKQMKHHENKWTLMKTNRNQLYGKIIQITHVIQFERTFEISFVFNKDQIWNPFGAIKSGTLVTNLYGHYQVRHPGVLSKAELWWTSFGNLWFWEFVSFVAPSGLAILFIVWLASLRAFRPGFVRGCLPAGCHRVYSWPIWLLGAGALHWFSFVFNRVCGFSLMFHWFSFVSIDIHWFQFIIFVFNWFLLIFYTCCIVFFLFS